jgi:hypothetical protein
VTKTCGSCGDEAVYLVTVAYARGKRGGRLMCYCESCRDNSQFVQVALPLDIDEATIRTLIQALYAHGWSESDPQTAYEVLGIEIHRV